MSTLIYIFLFVLFVLLAVFLQVKYCFLCTSVANANGKRPYSFARTQLTWWTFLVLSTFISVVLLSGKIPTLDQSTLILLGIGSLTTISARVIDINDIQNNTNQVATANATPATDGTVTQVPVLAQSICTGNFLTDILSDKNGVSIHRFQAFMFNLVFGLWFIYQSIQNLKSVSAASAQQLVDATIPIFTQNNLILLGISAGVYTALKSTENK